MEFASSPRAKPSSGPPFARGDNKMTNKKKKSGDKQQRQHHVSAGSIKKASSRLSSPSRLPVLVPPRSQRCLVPVADESAMSSRRRAWPAMATTTGTRNITSRSPMIGSSASNDHLYSSGSALRKKLSQRCCRHRDSGGKGTAPPSETATSTIWSKYSSNMSPTVMEQCLAVLSQGTGRDNKPGDPLASSSSGPPTSMSDREIHDESNDCFTDDEEASCTIHGDVDDLLTRPPPRLEDMAPASAGDECDGKKVVSGPESGGGEKTTLRRDRGDGSFPKILLRDDDIAGVSNGDKCGGGGGSAGGRKMGGGDIGQSGASARENVKTRATNSPSTDSDKSGSKTDGVSGSLGRRRRRDKPVITRNRSGLRRRNRVDTWPSPSVQHVVNRGMPGDHSSNCRRHPASGFVKDFDGIDTALVVEAFAFADRIARHETEEDEMATANFLRTSSDAHLNKAGQTTTAATATISANYPVPSQQGYNSQRGRLRRANPMGAAARNASTSSVDNNGRGNEKEGWKPVASALRLGEKYDSSNASALADDWLRGMAGGKETRDPSTCNVKRHVELGSGIDKSLGAQSAGRGYVNANDTFIGSKVDNNLAPRSTVVSSSAAAKREEAACARSGLRVEAYHYLGRHHRGQQQQDNGGRNNDELCSCRYDSGNGHNDEIGGSRRVQLEAKRASMTAELVKRFETGSGIAELQAELEASHASMRRSAEAIREAAGRWRRLRPVP